MRAALGSEHHLHTDLNHTAMMNLQPSLTFCMGTILLSSAVLLVLSAQLLLWSHGL